jgi:hypothetical protein
MYLFRCAVTVVGLVLRYYLYCCGITKDDSEFEPTVGSQLWRKTAG